MAEKKSKNAGTFKTMTPALIMHKGGVIYNPTDAEIQHIMNMIGTGTATTSPPTPVPSITGPQEATDVNQIFAAPVSKTLKPCEICGEFTLCNVHLWELQVVKITHGVPLHPDYYLHTYPMCPKCTGILIGAW